MSLIWLYSDDGASEQCIKHTMKTINNVLCTDNHVVKLVSADHIIHVLPEVSIKCKPKLIIFPGGADMPYHGKLKGIGCKNIRNYVNSGGNYLGICAGGYFGCSNIHFRFDNHVCSFKRELSFDDALHCCGPIIGKYVADSEKGARTPLIKVPAMNNALFNVYYNGGGHFYFTNKESRKKWVVLAKYHRLNKNAIICGKFGKGTVILTGIHPEMDSTLMDCNEEYLQKYKVIETLGTNRNSQHRLNLMRMILNLSKL